VDKVSTQTQARQPAPLAMLGPILEEASPCALIAQQELILAQEQPPVPLVLQVTIQAQVLQYVLLVQQGLSQEQDKRHALNAQQDNGQPLELSPVKLVLEELIH